MPAVPQPSDIVSVFDRAAGTYDSVGVAWFGPIAAGLVQELAPQPGEYCLDVGCGRGAATRPLAEAVGPNGTVLGVDLSPRMVEATRLDVADLPHVTIAIADASDLGLTRSSYQVIASSLVLFFLSEPAVALRSWTTLLVPGGRLGVTTFGPVDPWWRGIDAVFEQYLPESRRNPRSTGTASPFASDAGMEGLLTGAGLSDVRTATQTVSVTFENHEQWHAFSWSHGQRALWEAVPQNRRAEVKAQCFEVLDDARGEGGRVTLTQGVRYTLGHKTRSVRRQ